MLKILHFIIIFLILGSFNGCNMQENRESDSNFTKSNRQNGSIEQNTTLNKEEDKVLRKIGISTENGKIVIEPNKTKEFLETVAKKFESEAIKLQQKAKDINISTLGIKKESDKIVIDINQTQKTLEKISKDLENIAKEIGKIFQ